MLRPGQLIGRYLVEERIGVGGMAEVWRVRHSLLGTGHALKILTRAEGEMRRRLRAEGAAQARLRHPNLLPVRSVLTVGGAPALLMPLIDGPSLRQVLARYTPTRAEALALIRAITRGAHYAHQQGMVHRDIKPGNVLLERDRGRIRPRLGDFGLVKVGPDRSLQTQTGARFGTPAYAAPEQLADASRVDRRADLYSLGVMLHELLLGARPSPRGPLALPDDEPLAPLLAAMLAPAPADRPADGAAVLRALDAAAAEGAADSAEVLVASGPLGRAAWDPAGAVGDVTPPGSSETLLFGGETLATVARPEHNLPARRDRFLGRAAELAELTAALTGGARLLTITGFGGAGKSRLAVELGHRLVGAMRGGVHIVELSEARDVDAARRATAQALSVRPGADPAAAVVRALRSCAGGLVILDNFEQLVGVVEQTVGVWRAAAPDTALLVTSRRPLRLPDERLLALGPLGEADGIALFIDRARRLAPGWSPGEAAAAALPALVARLDGMPLAIELAAAHTRSTSPAALAEELSAHLGGLTSSGGGGGGEGGAASRPPRQRSLQATLEWSWSVLSPHERLALVRCSVFEGPFTAAAAEAVMALEGLPDAPWADALLTELVESGLLRVELGPLTGRPLLRMLQGVREFAAEKCPPAEREATERRHADWWSGQLLQGRSLEERRADIEHLPDLLAAAWRTVQQAAAEPELLLSEGFWAALVACRRSGANPEALRLVEAALALDPEAPLIRGFLLEQRGSFLRALGRTREAIDALEEGLALSRAHGLGGTLRGSLLRLLGYEISARDPERGEALLEEARAHCRDIGYRLGEGSALGQHASLLRRHGRHAEAEAAYLESLALLAPLEGYDIMVYVIRGNYASVLMDTGRQEEGRLLYLQNARAYHRVGERHGEGLSWLNLALFQLQRGALTTARKNFASALRIFRQIHDRHYEGLTLGDMGLLCRTEGRLAEGELLYSQALAIHRESGARRSEGVCLGNLGELQLADGRVDAATETLRQAVAVCDAVRYRIAAAAFRGTLGLALARQGEHAAAARSFDEGEAVMRSTTYPVELAKLLCRRALALACAPPSAEGRQRVEADLTEAAALAEELQLAPGSELLTLLDEARAAQGGAPHASM